jgi:plasmid maintenance system killer protein
VPWGDRLERLAGGGARQGSIGIDDQWRIRFRFDGGHAVDADEEEFMHG